MRDYLQQSESRIPMSESHDLMDATVEVVSAYLSHNAVSTDQVPSFIGSVHSALSRLGEPAEAKAITAERPEPAVPIKKSVFPDYIVCLEDGKKLKMLKRHSALGLQHDAGRISRALGSARRLPDGSAGICGVPFPVRPAIRSRPQGRLKLRGRSSRGGPISAPT